jgi:predicted dehydrogenase
MEEALETNIEGIIIASPSKLHYPQTVIAIERGIPVLVEKPLASSLKEAIFLEKLASEKNAILLNGLNMRFHPSIIQVKKMLEQELIGRVYSIRAISGYYLPDWHPQNDYRKSYSANKSLGGGVLLDGIHELDYIKWFFGDINHLYCMGGKVSNLEIDTEDMVELFIKFSNGVYGEIHINYLNRTRLREFVIVGENGIISWDSSEGVVKHFDSRENCWKVYTEGFEFHINDTYVLQMKHFINCIIKKEKPLNDVKEGRCVIEIVESAKKSMETGQPVKLST